MHSGKQKATFDIIQKGIITLFFGLLITTLFILKNIVFQPTLLLKSLGDLSIDPEIALQNNKPTFLEFYAEWCEVCKEIAPKVSSFKDEYDGKINFVFLNVDNPKWNNYIRDFHVNGIPQINLLNNTGNLEATFIGKQEEKLIKQSLDNLILNLPINSTITSLDSSQIRKNKNYVVGPRSHG